MTTVRTFLFGIVLLIGLVVSTSASSVELDGNLVIQTKFGQIQGLTENGVDKWKGIPYAAPPNGQRRFALPVDPQPWTGVKKTTAPASICPQIHVLGHWLGNEDCLYANVYAPSNRTEPLPVFVWIYGGGWNFGDGIEFGLYEAENFVNANNVIVVTFNYRLGPLGFLSLPALKKEGQGSVGSYAIYDQIHLLQWVQNNIAAFGGEPDKVTIGGESAGAFSTCIHIASPLSKGLFRGAIMESGTCVSDIFFVDEERSFAWSENYIQHLGCDPTLPDSQVLQCIRSLDMGKVMAANMTGNTGFVPMMFPDMSWGATIDGQLLADTPFAIISSGQSNQVPLIAGTNQDEGTIFSSMFQDMVPSISNPLKFGDMEAIMNHFFGDNATVISMVQSIYPESAYANATLQVQTVIRDYFFLCPMSRALLAQSEFGPQTWLYQFVYQGHWIEDAFIGSDYHSAELEFVFNNPWPPLVHAFNDRDQAMATSFGTYWSNFVKFQNPNGPADGSIKSNQPYWNPYEPTQLQSIAMDVPPSMTARLHEDRCQMWDKLAPWAPPLPKKMVRGRRKDRPIEFE